MSERTEPGARWLGTLRRSWAPVWRAWGSEVAAALWPRRCSLCAAATAGTAAVAPRCSEHDWPLGLGGSRCGRCAARLGAGLPDGARCAACRLDRPSFDGVVGLGDWRADAGLRAFVFALKYGQRRDLGRELGRWLASVIEIQPAANTALVPVPLHRWRRLERGYDQALELARGLSEETGVPIVKALVRTRPTTPQGAPGAASRRANVRAAFAPRRRARSFAGAEVWLVDDVLSSGSTASECARVLRRAGAERVRVFVAARGAATMGA